MLPFKRCSVRSFNILDPTTSIFGPKLLEASAGTGKTFTIEHLFVRLMREGGIPLEQILVITFTRAATRELRMRIRTRAAIPFDRAQIFTIHGFCHRILSRFSLEFQGDPPSRSKMKHLLGIAIAQQDILAPEQLGLLLTRRTISELCDALLDAPLPETEGSFADDLRAIPEQPPFDIRSEYERIAPQYKKIPGYHDVEDQLDALENLPDVLAFRRLLFWKGALLRMLSSENRKVRIKEISPSPYFDWASRHLLPLIEEATNSKRLFARLRSALQPLFDEKNFFSPDLLLERCRRASRDSEFCRAVQNCYQAVIVDEFQDTDAAQWEILERLFSHARTFCLVGDPKQSIYRFRKADLYTYFRARDAIGRENCYSLDTNYRSTPELLSALNDLFRDEHVEPWLILPEQKRSYPYLPLKTGLAHSSGFDDGKKPLQFFRSKNPLAYVAAELARICGVSIAILVKDHTEAAEVKLFLQERGLSASLKNQIPLSRLPSFRLFEEHLDRYAEEQPFHLPAILRTMPSVPDFSEIAERLLEMEAHSYEQVKRNFRTLEIEEVPRMQEQEKSSIRILTMHASKGLEFDLVFALGVGRSSPTEEEQDEQAAEKLRQLYVALTRAKKRVYVPLDPAPNSPLDLFFQKSKVALPQLMEKNSYIGCDYE